jgi:hypothetical protein
MDSPLAGDLNEQAGSGQPRHTASAPVSEVPGGIAAIHPSRVSPSLDKRAWPEWALAGESDASGLEPRQSAAGAIGFSRTFIGWSIWRERPPSRPAAATSRTLRVVATAACTSIVVSLVTMWLSVREGSVRSDSGGTVTVSYEPLATSVVPHPSEIAAQPVVEHRVFHEPAQTREPSGAPTLEPTAAPIPTRSTAARTSRSSGAAGGGGATRSSFVVITEPEGARVTINGLAYGTSPLTVPELAPGAKRIRVTKDGYGGEERVVRADTARTGITLRIELRETHLGTPR